MTVRDLLLRAYPRPWQAEFGPELADILANKKLTAALIIDILASAARQHFRQDPWKICAVGLSVWTAVLLIIAIKGLPTQRAVVWCYFIGQLFLFIAGAWTGLTEHSGIWRATAASLKAAVVPAIECMAVNTIAVTRYWGHFAQGVPLSAYRWMWAQMAMLILVSFLFGIGGASVAWLVQVLRGKTQASAQSKTRNSGPAVVVLRKDPLCDGAHSFELGARDEIRFILEPMAHRSRKERVFMNCRRVLFAFLLGTCSAWLVPLWLPIDRGLLRSPDRLILSSRRLRRTRRAWEAMSSCTAVPRSGLWSIQAGTCTAAESCPFFGRASIGRRGDAQD